MKHRTAAERRAMVAKFRRSGLSQAAFAAKHRVCLGTLRAWIYHPDCAQEEVSEPQNRFIEISAAAGTTGPEVILRIGEQLVLELDALPDPSYLAELSSAIMRLAC